MTLRMIAALTVAAGLSACATLETSTLESTAVAAPIETSTRNVGLDTPFLQLGSVTPQTDRDYNVLGVQVVVPETLRATESNAYYPDAEIVWRGDPPGDRRAQMQDLFETAAAAVTRDMNGAEDVFVQIQLVRFHGVTERTRYTVGGIYNMIFDMQIVDPEGNIIEPQRRIEANLPAPGGLAATRLDAAGQTEKVRVTNFLAFVIDRELSPVEEIAPEV